MACKINSAIALDCIDSLGGIREVYVGTDVDLGIVRYNSIGEITGLPYITGTFYKYELPKDTASFTETFNISNTNGSAFYDQAITINLHKLNAFKRKQLLLLSKNRNIKVILQDNNLNYWLIGKDDGAILSAGTSVTGTAVGDANQYSLTISAQEKEMAPRIRNISIVFSPANPGVPGEGGEFLTP